ncbi:MAG: (Fe-S)-binding protein [Candidatus Geothermincolales bacterium]
MAMDYRAEKAGKYDFFDLENCDLCGECFYRCPYLGLGRSEAMEEIKRLVHGLPSRYVHERCVSCYACDTYCAKGCRPYELVIRTWYERYLRRGLPVRAAYLMPAKTPNFRTDLVPSMTERERALLKKWSETLPEGDLVLYPGCNALTLPHLLDTPLLDGLTISGSFDLCCGEMYFRMGIFDAVERTAERLTLYFRDRDIGTMLFVCPACLNMFRNVLPSLFGAEFSFKTRYLGEFILERLDAGELQVRSLQERKVAVHDSCHGRVLGREIMETARDLYRRLGLTPLEIAPDPSRGLCCGMAAGCNRYRPEDMYLASVKELRAASRTGADEIATYCGGCHLTLNLMKWIYPVRQPVRHLMEYLRMAAGERVDLATTPKRSLRMLANITVKALPKIASRKNFYLDAV